MNKNKERIELLSLIVLLTFVAISWGTSYFTQLDQTIRLIINIVTASFILLSIIILYWIKLSPNKIELLIGIICLILIVTASLFSTHYFPYRHVLSITSMIFSIPFAIYLKWFRKKND